MLTLFSTIISFAMGGLPKLLDFFQDKSDKKHELELAQLQMQQQLAMAQQGFQSQERVEEIRSDQIAMTTQVQEREALYAHDIAIGQGASQWVVNARAMVRPSITYGMFLLLAFVDVFGFWYAWHTAVPFDIALNQLWDDDSQQIFASVIAFWFGTQSFKK
jgi:D-alanyl-D-alanine carboxypeptidase